MNFLRLYWLRNTKDQNRPARILFCVCPSDCTPQAVVRFAPKIFEDIDWQDFIEIRSPGNHDTKAVFFKDATFYTYNGSSFTPLIDDTIRIQPYSTIPNHSMYIEIIYSTLQRFGIEIENTLESLLHKSLTWPVEALLKATFTYGTDQRNLYVEKVQLLKSESFNDTVKLEPSQHLFIRLDREKKAFLTETDEPLNCATWIRPIISTQNANRKTWRNFLLFSELMHNIRDVLFSLFWSR